MNPTIFEDWLRYMESFSKEIRRSLEISQGRWKIAGKNSGELQRSEEDGKIAGKFPNEPQNIGKGRRKNAGKISYETSEVD